MKLVVSTFNLHCELEQGTKSFSGEAGVNGFTLKLRPDEGLAGQASVFRTAFNGGEEGGAAEGQLVVCLGDAFDCMRVDLAETKTRFKIVLHKKATNPVFSVVKRDGD